MARTVAEAFNLLLARLTPMGSETDAAKAHRASIYDCLRRNFAITAFFRTGSFGHGTSIRGYSDVDYFAVIPPEHLWSNSSRMLAEVARVLDARFPRTGVHIDPPAVVVPFGSDPSETTEVVPAYDAGSVRGAPSIRIFGIPNGQGGWMQSSPELHNAYVDQVDLRLSNKVKSLIRFVKAWRYFCNARVSSFYLELRTTSYANTQKTIVYSIDVKEALRLMWSDRLAPFQDPMGVSGAIAPCTSLADYQDASGKLQNAYYAAEAACQAEGAGDTPRAFVQWNYVFCGQFPRYY